MNTVLNLVGEKKKNILDLGCGDGYIMELFRKKGHAVEGIEIATHAIQKARAKGFAVYDFSLSEPWAHLVKNKYDVVFGGEIIEHIFDTDLFLKEIRSVLKPKGSVILTTPNLAALGRRILLCIGKNPHIETTARAYDAGHVRYFMRDTLRKVLVENKFKIESLSSSVVNFNNQGTWYSERAARYFPSLGNNIIIHAIK